MKSIRVHELGPPEVMKLEDVPDPVPGAGEVLVRAQAAGVNPVDTYIRAGRYVTPPLPYTPGADAAGIVESVGEGVTRFKPGQRVYVYGSISGTYAEKVLCRQAQVFPLPDALSFAQGAAIGVPYGTAYRALYQRARAQPGDVVLIHGATGGVGTAALQIARAGGMTVIATGGTEKGRELLRRQGADHVLDHRAPDYLDEAMRITGGRGVDIILEMLANVNLDNDLKTLALHGRVVVIGNRGRIEIDPRETMRRDAAILGMTLMNTSESDLARIHAALQAGMRDGWLRPIIGQEIPLADAPRAHHEIIEQTAYGKIVLIP